MTSGSCLHGSQRHSTCPFVWSTHNIYPKQNYEMLELERVLQPCNPLLQWKDPRPAEAMWVVCPESLRWRESWATVPGVRVQYSSAAPCPLSQIRHGYPGCYQTQQGVTRHTHPHQTWKSHGSHPGWALGLSILFKFFLFLFL